MTFSDLEQRIRESQPIHDTVFVKQAIDELEEKFKAWADLTNWGWTIICNVSEGDWTKQTQEWQDAAAKFREQYHGLLDSSPVEAEVE